MNTSEICGVNRQTDILIMCSEGVNYRISRILHWEELEYDFYRLYVLPKYRYANNTVKAINKPHKSKCKFSL